MRSARAPPLDCANRARACPTCAIPPRARARERQSYARARVPLTRASWATPPPLARTCPETTGARARRRRAPGRCTLVGGGAWRNAERHPWSTEQCNRARAPRPHPRSSIPHPSVEAGLHGAARRRAVALQLAGEGVQEAPLGIHVVRAVVSSGDDDGAGPDNASGLTARCGCCPRCCPRGCPSALAHSGRRSSPSEVATRLLGQAAGAVAWWPAAVVSVPDSTGAMPRSPITLAQSGRRIAPAAPSDGAAEEAYIAYVVGELSVPGHSQRAPAVPWGQARRAHIVIPRRR